MNFANPVAIRLRTLSRRIGFLPPIMQALRSLSGAQYEQRFDRALRSAVRIGDTVWDVGANAGLYTAKFADWVTDTGRVAAFEPSPSQVAQLQQRFAANARVAVIPVALAAEPGVATFYVNGAADGTTDSLLSRSPDAIAHSVAVRTGDSYRQQFAPQVIKIDVEGYEWEVLQGMQATLRDPSLRCVLVEVHFGLLNDRGIPEAPQRICQLLESSGFKISWVDSSHLCAERRDPA